MNNLNEVEKLNDTVIKGGYCVGCGICATVDNSPFEIKYDIHSKLQAFKNSIDQDITGVKVLELCPFSDESRDEDEIGKELYGSKNTYHNKLGYINSSYAGHVVEKEFRNNGSSGGMGTWILTELLSKNLVDGIIHVKPTEEENLFKYAISNSSEEILEGASSRYYPIELSEVVTMVKNRPGRYAIIGLPCFIKSIRLLSNKDSIIKERIKFCIGLVCGHLKSAHFASMWSWQLGIHPNDLENINFRYKLNNDNASKYAVSVEGNKNGNKTSIVSPALNELYGANWGWGFFKYKACDYCDDVVGETADISIGDAWLPEYIKDSNGTNVIVIRNPIIAKLIKSAREDNRLYLEDISPEKVVQSQSSGFNHRREGLAYRLHLKDQNNEWRPNKRISANSNHLSKKLKKRQDLRIELAKESHIVFQEALEINEFKFFRDRMEPLVIAYEKTYRTTLVKKILNRVKKVIKWG